MISEIREWVMLSAELYICAILTLEYFYDYNKDEMKKQRKTRTSKKITQSRDGVTTTEETNEITEPVEEKK